jgi:hypothetical protein
MLHVGAVVVLTAGVLVATATPAFAVAHVLTPIPITGPAGGLNTITATTPTATPTFVAGVAVQFQLVGTTTLPATQVAAAPATTYAACWPSYSSTGGAVTLTQPVTNASAVKFSVNKLYITVPATVLVVGTAPTKYHVCVYSGTSVWTANTAGNTGSLLIANATAGYSVSAAATLSTITPVSGPSKGGTPIIVTGTNLLGATATLGGAAMTPLVIAADGLSFTAVTPAHVAEALPVVLSVTTAGGMTNKLNAYTYSNGIIVTPNTAPRSAATGTYIEVAGVGFSSLTITSSSTNGGTPDSVGGHVYLNRGTYDRTPVAGHKAVGETTECTDVLVMSDVLLLCKVGMTPLARTFNDGTTTNTTFTLTSPTANFTAADVGMSVTDGTIAPISTGIGAGNTIAAIVSPTEATLTVAAALTGTQSVIIGSTRLIAAATATISTTTLTAGAGTGHFTAADVGRPISGTGIASGSTIASVTSTDVVELSVAASGAVTTNVTITNLVPDGTYTITVVNDGRSSGVADPNYAQSIISSGSTFTIGDYLVD